MSELGRRTPAHFAGCLLGGAVGDALGAPVEFLWLAEIRAEFGPQGIGAYEPIYGRLGAITDDTQMTLFTAEGLLRADNRWREKGICYPPDLVYRAYLRWLDTQGELGRYVDPEVRSGWLLDLPELRSRRAPGNTCLAALRSGRPGSMEHRLNDSKGCGGAMRVAPVGLAGTEPFRLGCELAALTHGHPSGFLAAGAFAAVIAGICDGASLEQAIDAAVGELRTYPEHEQCLAAIERAVQLAQDGAPSAQKVELLGRGWVAEEALAIALYCALAADGDFERGVRLAVNHGGDSDSTGSMAGNILGALLTKDAIPSRWLEQLELRDVIEQVAMDLYRHFGAPVGSGDVADWERYPGW
jgi:ADP-ribosylglycohydrolase